MIFSNGLIRASVVASLVALAACETPPLDDGSASADNVLVEEIGGSGSSAFNNDTGMGYLTAPDGTVSDVPDRVFYAYDSSVLSSEAKATLQRQAEWLNKYSVNAVIEGHCDERGTKEYNMALGARRAEAAKNYLVSLGVSAERLSTVSYGKERPVDMSATDAAWSKNRRGVTVVTQ